MHEMTAEANTKRSQQRSTSSSVIDDWRSDLAPAHERPSMSYS